MLELKFDYFELKRNEWVIFVVNQVDDRSHQVRYQRIVCLAQRFNLIVVTAFPLPHELEECAQKICLCKKGFSLWKTVIDEVRILQHKGELVYVHTQYSPNPTIAGFLCKYRTGCLWVYDLWDHPSLGYELLRGPSRWTRQIIWILLKRYILSKADAWIVAMHPGILRYMPPAPVTCRLIFCQPGSSTAVSADPDKKFTNTVQRSPVKVAYAGPVMIQRGLDEIRRWALSHHGVPVELHLIGPCQDNYSQKLLSAFEKECEHNPDLRLEIYGELPHAATQKVLEASHIGICLLDTSVLNYRFAYPVKVVEQMRLGLIVVGTVTHGITSFIDDGVNGFLASPHKGGLTKAIQNAVACCLNPEQALEMHRAAMETVKDNSWLKINNVLSDKISTVVFN